jgi:hypothetical protein
LPNARFWLIVSPYRAFGGHVAIVAGRGALAARGMWRSCAAEVAVV